MSSPEPEVGVVRGLELAPEPTRSSPGGPVANVRGCWASSGKAAAPGRGVGPRTAGAWPGEPEVGEVEGCRPPGSWQSVVP